MTINKTTGSFTFWRIVARVVFKLLHYATHEIINKKGASKPKN